MIIEREKVLAPAKLVRTLAQESNRVEAVRCVESLTRESIETTGKGLQLAGADLTGLNMSGFDLRRADLNRAQLYGANLDETNLEGASLVCTGTERASFRNTNMRNGYLHALAAQVCDFADADLRNVIDATGSLFHGCNMKGARLDGAVLSGAVFYQCNLKAASFQSANLQGSAFNECILKDTTLRHSLCAELTITKSYADGLDLSQATGESVSLQQLTSFDGVCLEGAHLPGLSLSRVRADRLCGAGLFAPDARFLQCSFNQANLTHADLSRSSFRAVTLTASDFSDCRLSGASIIQVDAPGIQLNRAHGENMQLVNCSFKNAIMEEFEGRCVVIRDTDLRNANLRSAYLYRAMITADPPQGMSLQFVNLNGANLVQAYIACDLQDSSLIGANCSYARFNQSLLDRADLSGANLYQITAVKVGFRETMLKGVKGPFFTDRCAGLPSALRESNPGNIGEALAGLVEDQNRFYCEQGQRST